MFEFKQLSDSQLVALVQSTADTNAYSELVSRYQMSLFAFIYRYTNEKYLAEDITQDTFIKAYDKISHFNGRAQFKTWLFSIAYREFLQSKRKENALQKLLNKFEQHTTQQYLPKLDSSIDINNALKQLSDNQRAVILLCDASSMTNNEAATILQLPLGSVKTYIKQARSIMRSYLMCEEEDVKEKVKAKEEEKDHE
jgi:RNA polymerase sigma-70 factor (ECF subfamily)